MRVLGLLFPANKAVFGTTPRALQHTMFDGSGFRLQGSSTEAERGWQGQAFYEDLLGLPSDLSCVYTSSLRPYLSEMRSLRLNEITLAREIRSLANLTEPTFAQTRRMVLTQRPKAVAGVDVVNVMEWLLET